MPSLFPRPLRRRNFVLYFTGQITSNTGVWFQNLALSLWIVETTESARALSLVTVCQFAPILLLSGPAGAVADRFRARPVLLATAALSALCASALAFAAGTDGGRLPVLLGIVAVGGVVQAFERTVGQAFLFELVGAQELGAAVSLNTVAMSAARSIGPGLAGIAYATVGPAACFAINAGSYSFAIVALCLMSSKSFEHRRVRRSRGVEGSVRSLLAEKNLRRLFAANIAVTVLAMNFMVVVTAMVTLTLGGGPAQLGAAHALNAVGAVIGGLVISMAPSTRLRTTAIATAVLGIALGCAAASPNIIFYLAVSPLIGVGLGAFQSSLNSTVQTIGPPHLLGRSAALLTMTSVGVAPIGAVVAGTIVDGASARLAMVLGTLTCLVCGAVLDRGARPPRSRTPTAAEPHAARAD
ncbi:MFS transporter [Nocardia sp. NBC_00416]|uniref:MFS transporter n=1 Tax=Nocardia sp. NBC_00416 TaxID=2975991 RepID=UPI002E1EDAF8